MGEKAPIKRELTLQQKAFAEEYVRNGGKAKLAYQATYNTTMSSQSCCEEASRTLKKPHIRAYIDDLRADAVYRTKSDYFSLLQMGHELVAESRQKDQMKAAVGAYAELNKLTGFYRHRNKPKDEEGSQHHITIEVLDNGKVKKQ